jgi:heat shock protein HslJ
MKRIFFVCLLITVFLISCKSVPTVEKTADVEKVSSEFSTVTGKDWKLIEVRIRNVDTGFNRSSLSRSENIEYFTVNFNSEMISGAGAPNRYSAPYKLGEGKSISISIVRATLMATLFETGKLREHDFFGYIQNTSSWNIVNNNLVLSSKAENGNEVVMVFSL